MDEKLLGALNNLSDALEHIAETLSSKTSDKDSDASKALVSGDFTEQLNGINEGIKSIKEDTTNILSNQDTIMNMAKSKGDKDDLAAKVGGDAKKQSIIKDGLSTILLMGVAVVALGAAFGLVGNVDFGSVIALSLAIPLISLSLMKVAMMAKDSGFDPKTDGIPFLLTITGISLAVMASSYILGMVQPVSPGQLLTTILISGMFAVVGLSLGKILNSFKGVNPKDALVASLLMPLIFPALSIAIAASSLILGAVQPVGGAQLLSALAISLLFVPLGFAAGMMLKNFKGVDPATAAVAMISIPFVMLGMSIAIKYASEQLSQVSDVSFVQFLTSLGTSLLFIPLAFSVGMMLDKFKGISTEKIATAMISIPFVMVGMSMAIRYSSEHLSMVTGISLMQFITALGISILFIPLAFAAGLLVKMTKGIKATDIVKLPLFMVTMSVAVMLSSHILNQTADVPYSKMVNILATGATLAAIGVVLGGAMVLLNKMGKTQDYFMGGLAVVIISGAVMLSSHILGLGDYSVYPPVDWAAGVGLSMLAFGLPTLVMGMAILATGGVGLLAIAGGALATVVIAGAVAVSSHILAEGNYGTYPTPAWTGSVGLSMLAFGLPILGLGVAILATAGLGLLAIYAGAEAVTTIAQAVVDSSNILATGNYGSAPSAEWTGGVGLSMLAFGIPILALGVAIIATAGLGLLAVYAGVEAVETISHAIVNSSNILSTGNYSDNYPSIGWATGVGLSLMAFAPAVVTLGTLSAIPFVGGKILEGGKEAVLGIARTIVEVADILSKGTFSGGPTETWANSVAIALGAFSPIYSMMMANGAMNAIFGGGISVDEFSDAIETISKGIVSSAESFNNVTWGTHPTEEWAKGVGGAIGAFAPVYDILSANTGLFSSGVSVEDFKSAIKTITGGIIESNGLFKDVDWGGYPSVEWVEGVGGAIGAFSPVFDIIMNTTFSADNLKLMNTSIISLSKTMAQVGSIFTVNDKWFQTHPDSEWGVSLDKSVSEFIALGNKINELDDTDFGKVKGIARQMAGTAAIFSVNSKYFKTNIDPNFIKNIGANVLDYTSLLKQLPSGGIGDALKNLTNTDPMSNITNGMFKMAGAYDKLSESINKFGGSINGLDLEKVNAFGMMTNNIAVLSAMDSEMFDSMMDVLESRTSVFADLLQVQYEQNKEKVSVGDTQTTSSESELSKSDELNKELITKFDQMIGLLNNISSNSGNIDDHLSSKIEGTKDLM